ncbi:hypothetical protein JB92DRAFT_1637824 [Gautieria morchelliformis]|nr:hypothetical protein JB92DRAFT_1637824 [Gautieria morchelliformis]
MPSDVKLRAFKARRRVVLCICAACRAENPGGRHISKVEQESHEEAERRRHCQVYQRGRMTRYSGSARANAVDTKSILPLRGKAALALRCSSSSRNGPGRSVATSRPNQPSSQAHDLLNCMDLDVEPPEHLSVSHPSRDEDHLAGLGALQEPLAHAPAFTDEYEAICNRYYEALGDPADGCAFDSRPQSPDISTNMDQAESGPRVYRMSDCPQIFSPSPSPCPSSENGADLEEESAPASEVIPPPTHNSVSYRFNLPEPRPTAETCYHNSHPDHWWIRLTLLLVAFLHTSHHVSFCACGLILFTMRSIFVALGMIPLEDSMPTTLQTSLKHLSLEDRFSIYVLCSQCNCFNGVWPNPDATAADLCTLCASGLYTGVTNFEVSQFFTRKRTTNFKPKLSTPFQSLSSLLSNFLSRAGMEEAVEQWRSNPRQEGVYKEIMDGRIWNTMRGPDGKLFFAHNLETNELRIGLTLSLDWFGISRSESGPHHSSGVLSFCVANLPDHLRYRPQNLLVCSLPPGPREVTAKQLQQLLLLVVDDLLRLYNEGIMILTPLHPEEHNLSRH